MKRQKGCSGATARNVNGQLVMDDPETIELARGIAKTQCSQTLLLNCDRVEHFKHKMLERGLTADKALIVILNIDDVHGGQIAQGLMPGYNWQKFRDQGEVPFARGIVMREPIQATLDVFDKEASEKPRAMKEVAIVVVDHNVAEVFAA